MTPFRMTIACAATSALLASCAGRPAGKPGQDAAALGAPAAPAAALESRIDPELLEILGYAAKASSSHNAQPWRIEAAASGTLKLMADRSRYLPAVDPENREMFLSFGAFLENLQQAARALGWEAEIAVTAESVEAEEIARIRLERVGGRRDAATLNVIASTYTPKGSLGTKPLDRDTLAALGPSRGGALSYHAPGSPAFRWVLSQAPKAGLQQAWRDPAQEELADYLHFSRKSARRAGYGLTPEMMEIAPVGRFFWYTFMNRKSALSGSFRNSIEGITARQLDACAGLFILTSTDGSPTALVEAGRAYQRLKLAAFRLGIGIHPVSALLEERPWNQEVGRRLGSGRPVQFILRAGRLEREAPSFETDAVTSASIRMKPEQFLSAP
ncbi:MAG: hypothetical protein JW820_20780 [Spirochaetales bacterium]|nr:hypothetical protein [Spirochaetales bacterium]